MLGVAYKTHLSHTYYIIITKDKSIINSCKKYYFATFFA